MKSTSKAQADGILMLLYLLLITIGLFTIHASTVHINAGETPNFFENVRQQLVWIGLAISLIIAVQWISANFWRNFSYTLYAFSILLLILVLFFGSTIKGSTSWFFIAGISIQPAEIAKLCTALILASYLSYYNTRIKRFKNRLVILAMILIPVILIMLQPDAGSALVFLSFGFVLFREGMSAVFFIILFLLCAAVILSLAYPLHWVILGFLAVGPLIIAWFSSRRMAFTGATLLCVVLFFLIFQSGSFLLAITPLVVMMIIISYYLWTRRKGRLVMVYWPMIITIIGACFLADFIFEDVLRPHQQDRINVWLHPEKCDPYGSLYNTLQSKMAIGSGGFYGKGYLEGDMTNLNYIPEQSTDFIFSTIAEEHGFLGSLIVVLLFLFLIYRILMIGERSEQKFTRAFAYGVAGIIFTHMFINIGMTLGVMPVIGIPLPFISKGGSSLLIFSLMIGILLKLDVQARQIRRQ